MQIVMSSCSHHWITTAISQQASPQMIMLGIDRLLQGSQDSLYPEVSPRSAHTNLLTCKHCVSTQQLDLYVSINVYKNQPYRYIQNKLPNKYKPKAFIKWFYPNAWCNDSSGYNLKEMICSYLLPSVFHYATKIHWVSHRQQCWQCTS